MDYIQYADFILIRNISNYIYRVEYSDTALSVCNKSLKEECEIFQNYYYRVILYQQEYNLKADDLQLVWKELKIFFIVFCCLYMLVYQKNLISYEKLF